MVFSMSPISNFKTSVKTVSQGNVEAKYLEPVTAYQICWNKKNEPTIGAILAFLTTGELQIHMRISNILL